MSIRNGLIHYHRHFGFRGVLAITAYRLFGHPKEILAYPPAIRHPVHLRLRTSDQEVYPEILLDGFYACDLPTSLETIVDAGANIGMASIYFAHRYPKARIIAIEAEASNFALLAKNVRLYPSITPIHAALWSRDGHVSVSQPDPAVRAGGEYAFFTHEGPGEEVRAITMRTLMKALGIHSLDLLKVDIEGAEKEVFETCDWIDSVRCLLIELHDRFKPGCTNAVDSALRGYSKSQRGETTLYIREL